MTRAPGQPYAAFSRKNAARLLLVLGAITLALTLGSRLPRDQTIRIVFTTTGTGAVRQVTLAWKRPDDTDPLGGVTLYPHGASRDLSHTLRLPDGEYVLEIEVETLRPDGDTLITAHRRRVELHGEPATLYLGDRK